jgi:hypothetical protein
MAEVRDKRNFMSIYGGPEIITSGLILHLDAANNKSYSGSGNIWFDLSGNNNNGTLTNGPIFNSSNGGNIVFDGTNDEINCGNQSTNPNNLISVTCFTKSSIISNYQPLVARVASDYTYINGFELTISNSKVRAILRGPSGGSALSLLGNTNLLSNIWYMLSFTWNNNTCRVYVNDKQDNFQTPGVAPTLQLDSVSNLLIGKRATGDTLSGNIAQVCLYNRELSANEIRQNYNALKGRFNL